MDWGVVRGFVGWFLFFVFCLWIVMFVVFDRLLGWWDEK